MKQSPFFRLLAIGAMTAMPVLAFGQDVNPAEADLSEPPAIYSPYVERTANDNTFAEGLYWGDTHLHTNFSTDSGMIGNKLGPEEAYRTDPDFDSAHRAVGGNRKFPICGNRKPHTLVVGGGCPAFHDVDDVNNEGAGHRCMDGRRGCC